MIGRALPSDVILADSSLSRVHAKVTWRGDEIVIEDLGSTNGIFVGDERVRTATIAAGADGVMLGRVRLVAHGASFVPADARSEEGEFAAHISAELRRASGFRRPLALMAVRYEGGTGERIRALRECLRPVDASMTVGADVVLVALAEAPREELASWASRFRAAVPDAALRFGAAVYPDHGEDGDALARAALDALSRAPRGELRCASASHPSPSASPEVILESATMRALYDLITRVARTRMPILIVGETGSGKELAARAVHDASSRAAGPFRAINCATIPVSLTESALFGHEKGAFTGAFSRATGLFEDANGGTVFLDEIGELAPSAQAALLRVLETGRMTRVGGTREIAVDVRVVAATHRDLAAMVAQGTFREDLLYRLDAMTLEVPPLRDRLEDIAPLARGFIARAAEHWGTSARELDEAVIDALRAYHWPGNVRQLRNIVDRAAAISVGSVVTLADLPPDIARLGGASPIAAVDHRARLSLAERVAAFEREILRETLANTNGNQSRAAELLGIPRRTLAHKVKRHGLG